MFDINSKTFVVPSLKGICCLDKRSNPAMRKSSSPYISGDTFRSICDFIIDEARIPFDPVHVQDGDIIFLNADFMNYFFSEVHQHIKSRYILVTHNSDCSIPGKYENYLDDERLIAWFGQNVNLVHPKLIPIPIGFANRYWAHGDMDIIKRVVPRDEKKIFLYFNVVITTNKAEREFVHSFFKNKSFCTVSQKKPFEAYLNDLACSKFVVSPPGNGIDCHRTWEALCMGAFPIVKSSPMDSIYEGLPVVIIKDWKVVTQNFLEEKYEQMIHKEYAWEKLYADYWINKIITVKYEVRNSRMDPVQ